MTNESNAARRAREFDAKHGPESYSDGATLFFRDGSTRDTDPRGLLYDATILDRGNPEFEFAIASNRVTFFKLKLKQAVDAFEELDTRLHFGGVPADPDAAIAHLQRLQVEVDQRKRELTKAEAAFEATLWGRARKDARESEMRRLERLKNFQDRMRAIRI